MEVQLAIYSSSSTLRLSMAWSAQQTENAHSNNQHKKSNVCYVCQKLLHAASSTSVGTEMRDWKIYKERELYAHARCFVCAECKLPIDGKFYEAKHRTFFCQKNKCGAFKNPKPEPLGLEQQISEPEPLELEEEQSLLLLPSTSLHSKTSRSAMTFDDFAANSSTQNVMELLQSHSHATLRDDILMEKLRDVIEDIAKSGKRSSLHLKSISLPPKLLQNAAQSYREKYGPRIFEQFELDRAESDPVAVKRTYDILDHIELQDKQFGPNSQPKFLQSKVEPLEIDEKVEHVEILKNDPNISYKPSLSRLPKGSRVEYVQFKKRVHQKLTALLQKQTKHNMVTEASNEQCKIKEKLEKMKPEEDMKYCPSLQRLEFMLSLYEEIKNHEHWRQMPLSDLLTLPDRSKDDARYAFQELGNDWYHLKVVHVDLEKIGDLLCLRYEAKYKCANLTDCLGFQRQYRSRSHDEQERALYAKPLWDEKYSTRQYQTMNEKEMVFQQECDKIHSFLLHSTLKFGAEETDSVDDNIAADQRAAMIARSANSRTFSPSLVPQPSAIPLPAKLDLNAAPLAKSHANAMRSPTITPVTRHVLPNWKIMRKKEDEAWWQRIDLVDVSNDDVSHIHEGFNELAQNMGLFRYQSVHGFRTGQSRGLSHINPMFPNLKDEVLSNQYHGISKESWNGTLRKCKQFHQSWARRRIRTLYTGEYHDYVTNHREEWSKDVEISLMEVLAIKLYTDYDKLQFELKRCFRFNATLDFWQKEIANKQTDDEKEGTTYYTEKDEEYEKESRQKKENLERRLAQFFHWRIQILVVLNKFGVKLGDDDNPLTLYHGVNAQMMLNPTETMTFYGPFSTTSSFHVAKTFATSKGMILRVTTQYPKLGLCRAFNASLISDYPEEQEWLIGFIYLRILEVRAPALGLGDWQLYANAPIATAVRTLFFSINLFREQVFTMSENLEYYLKSFLSTVLPEVQMQSEDENRFTEYVQDFVQSSERQKEIDDLSDVKQIRRWKICKILYRMFDEFRKQPNIDQIIKIDQISPGLKPYFLDLDDEKQVNEDLKWGVSFRKINAIFPQIKEIYFQNSYKLNKKVLDKLIAHIQTTTSQISKVKFLYYDSTSENAMFLDPDDDTIYNGHEFDIPRAHQTETWRIKTSERSVGPAVRIYRVRCAQIIDENMDEI